jgi:hypothetical protein
MTGAMRTTIELPIRLDAVTDDAATAVAAGRRQHVNGALETVERVRAAIVRSNLERLVVGIAAEFAGSHGQYPVVGGLLVLPTSRKQKCRIWKNAALF